MDAYEAAYADIEQSARDGRLSEYLEEKSCEIFDRIAAKMYSPDAHIQSIGIAFDKEVKQAIHDWAQAEADGKHTRDGPKIDPNKWAFDNKLEST